MFLMLGKTPMSGETRFATVKFTKPIAIGDKDTVTGWVQEEGGAGVRVFANEDGTGLSQFFPQHLVEKITDIEEEEESNG